MSWYWVDIAILTIVLLSVITGLFRGFVKEFIALGVWIFAFWFAFNYGTILDPWVSPHVHDQTVKTIVEFIAILVISLILGGLVNAIIGFIMRSSGLGGTDRILGMGFGFARGVFIVAIIMLGIRMTGMSYEEYSKESRLYARFDPLVAWLAPYVPHFLNHVKGLDADKKQQDDKNKAKIPS